MLFIVCAAPLLLSDPPGAKPAAMVLDAVGAVEIEPPGGRARRVGIGDLLYPGERLAVPSDGAATLAILGAGVQEKIKPGSTATVGPEGCTPSEAVAERKRQRTAVASTMRGVRPVEAGGRKAGSDLRGGPEMPPTVSPIVGATVASDRPCLAWRPARPAGSYRVKLLSSAGRELWRVDTKETHVLFPAGKEALRRGNVYRWVVTDLEFRRVAAAEFMVATPSELKELGELDELGESGDRADRLAAAMAYRRLWAYAEAITAYEQLAAEAPEEPEYRRALDELYRQAGRSGGEKPGAGLPKEDR
jgi:hypothetical protein